MGFEATLHYSYAYNLEQSVTLFTGLGERSTSNLPLFPLLGKSTDFYKTNKVVLQLWKLARVRAPFFLPLLTEKKRFK